MALEKVNLHGMHIGNNARQDLGVSYLIKGKNMDLLAGMTFFEKLLDIKGKLWPQKTQIVVPEESQEINEKYCSIYIEYSRVDLADSVDDQNQIIIVLAKRSNFTVPVWSIDWVAGESSLDEIRPIEGEIPKPLLVGDEGRIIKVRFSEIMRVYLEDGRFKGRALKSFLNNLKLQCRFADGWQVNVDMPDTLKGAIYEYYQ